MELFSIEFRQRLLDQEHELFARDFHIQVVELSCTVEMCTVQPVVLDSPELYLAKLFLG